MRRAPWDTDEFVPTRATVSPAPVRVDGLDERSAPHRDSNAFTQTMKTPVRTRFTASESAAAATTAGAMP